jgi:DNA-binding MarR family transcriptional regulator
MRDSSAPSPVRAKAAATTLDALRRIVRALRLANGGVEKVTGLSAAQLFVLEQVAQTPGASLSELAARTLTDRTSVAAVVERLAARQLVERQRSQQDRRRVEIAPTEAGLAVLARAPHPPTRRILEGLESLDDGQLETLSASLAQLVRAMGIADEPALMLFEDDGGVPSHTLAADEA